MKAVICHEQTLSTIDLPEPVPGKGQAVIRVLRCGICGSDLHMRRHCDHMASMARRVGMAHFPDSADPLVFGHEFCGEVLDYGPGTRRRLPTGSRVCAVPLRRRGELIDLIGLSAHAPGAYAERVVVQADLMEAVPDGLSADLAALAEPMAVALHAYRRSEIRSGDVAVVIGCGPVGLGLIAMLKAHGVRTVIASDFSPGRRALAAACGADRVIDPAAHSPFTDWASYGHLPGMPDLLELAVSTREKLGRLPLPWWGAWRLAEAAGLKPKRPVVFECVGVPGVIRQLMEQAPLTSRIVVVGVCMQPDTFEPGIGINKEIELRFALGYSPLEYRDALYLLADGRLAVERMITGRVGLDQVAQAFTDLENPELHAKILIDPSM
ncbi:threonine dehydrogenase-like Zn-dependent dehydrogenase [Fluviicoccus keumensis]|uniref:Threonine dehydrogenase-like Zn-dependent dehydrogenase n=1 Tax=Fluviicoccus keumensis TaxID=1435465 RepID=A0A4V2G3X5_9GAMM|nr:zinc-binding dehydrogenase [Fluviicoccus keumensis]RZU38726.1 threonine dehydrogenase-like Zn-dependent dehydrogenase [Fluviicoccus keumensis]